MQSILRRCATAVAAAGLMLIPVAQAETQSSPQSSPKTTVQPADISDSKLDAVAAATKEVSVIRKNYEQKLAQTPEKDRDRLVGEADAAMTKAVTDKGLSVEEYVSIIEVAQNDAGVRGKLLQRLKD